MNKFERAAFSIAPDQIKIMAQQLRDKAKTDPDAAAAVNEAIQNFGNLELFLEDRAAQEGKEVYLNDTYQVIVTRQPYNVDSKWPAMIWLSIKRIDREVIHDFRHLQQIKNELVGPEHEAVELYPAESRLVDTANQYHLWCLEDAEMRFPFGFKERAVSDSFNVGKSKQRKFGE